MVSENTCQIFHRDVAKCGADGLEGSIAGSEDGDIGCGVDSLDKFGAGERASNRGQVHGNGSGGNIGRYGKEAVNDMDNAVVVGNILEDWSE